MKSGAFLSIIVLLLQLNNTVSGQERDRRSSGSFFIGYGFYSPNDQIRAAYEDYGGGTFGLRFLYRTDAASSRLRVGGEAAIQILARRSSDLLLCSVGCDELKPYLRGVCFMLLSDLQIAKTNKTTLHAAGGMGLLWAADDTDTEHFSSFTELAGTVKFRTAIPASQGFSIDPELAILKSFGEQKIFTVNLLMGLSYSW